MTLKILIEKSWKNIYQNKYAFLMAGSLLHFFMTVVGVNFLGLVFRIVLFISNQPNLNKDNFGAFFSNPVSILTFVIYVFLVAFLAFIEFSFLVNIVESRRTGSGFSLKKVFEKTLKNMRSLLGWQIFFFILYFALMIPFENLGLSSALLSRIKVPDFIVGEFVKSDFGSIATFVVLAVILYINLRLIFTLPLSILNEEKLSKNISKSWQITRKNKIKLSLAMLFFAVIFGFFTLGVSALSWLILSNFSHALSPEISKTIFFTITDTAKFIFAVMSKIAIVSVLLTYLDDSKFKRETLKEKRKRSKILIALVAVIFPSAILLNAATIYTSRGKDKILKIAHRGDVSGGVENSLEALESAKKKGANLVEMDIQLTKDGHFVVVHDTNLARLAGQKSRIGDLTLSEIQGLRISDGVFESKIPTFEEYVARAQELKIGLLVEVKPHGSESRDFPKRIVAEFHRLGISKKYRLMSLDLGLISKVEKLAPEIKTGVVVPLIFGDFDKDFDFYAVEDFSYREKFSRWAALKKREIFVWTINDRDRMSHYLQSDVDGIITDELDIFDRVKNDLSKNDFGDLMRLILVRS